MTDSQRKTAYETAPALRCVAFALCCWAMAWIEPAFAQAVASPGPAEFASGRILAGPKLDVTPAQFEAAVAAEGLSVAERLQGTDVYVVTVPPATELARVESLRARPEVLFAEPDVLAAPARLAPRSPLRTGWFLDRIGAPSAGGRTVTGAGVTVAILDTGIDVTHPDLAFRIEQRRDFFGAGRDVADLTGHGTAVAGVVAAVSNGYASIMPLRVADARGVYWSAVVKGLVWAADHGARVANVSFEGLSRSQAVRAASRYFNALGGVVVVPAGNTGVAESTSPADELVVVAATDQSDRIASWSTRGMFVDIAAPGQDIVTTAAGGGYQSWSGTSMATPMVSATAALLLALRPDLTAGEATRLMLASADPAGLGGESLSGTGRLDVGAAIAAASATGTFGAGGSGVPPGAFIPGCWGASTTVSMTPAQSAAVASGTQVSFSVLVTNHSFKKCEATTFDLSVMPPAAGWTASFSPSMLVLAPGASGTSTLQVRSPASATAGAYAIAVTAVGRNDPLKEATATATYLIGGATVPGAPTIGTASAGNAQATVTFTAPASNGGSPITSYRVTSNPGSKTATGSASPITVTGLTNGVRYTFTVQAINAIGTGPASAASNAVTPATVPGAPTIGTATAGNAQATVSFSAPASNGGSPITSYRVTSNPGGMAVTGGASPLTVTGLVNGTSYTFTVQAINAIGTGPASAASNAVTPATVPGAPTIGTATAGNAQATVSFAAPASNGGSPIASYRVTSSPGGFTATGGGSPLTVTGLANGTSYTFSVQAINAIGTGPASAASNAVTPATVPGAPTIGAATAGNAQATVSFIAPGSNGGSPITSYRVTSNPGGVTRTRAGSPQTVTGLANGTSYTFTVQAINAIGTGPASAASNAVTPTAGGGGASYTTNFPATENPISQGGMWINGKAVGLDWNNVQTTPGKAFAAAFVGGYDDPIAVLNTTFTANQYAQGTVYRAAGYSPSTNHEIELLLRFRITPDTARGYEILWGHGGELNVVRWNGPYGSYTPLLGTIGPNIGAAVDGDVLRGEIVGNVVRVYKNGTLVATTPADNTFADGQPGIGFWPRPGATLQSFGWKSFSAGSL
jgi:subtilisin family serine protease